MSLEDDLIALEQRVLIDAAGDFLKAVAELRTMLAMGSGGLQAKLASIAVNDFEQIIRNGILDAYQVGKAEALTSVRLSPVTTDADLATVQQHLPGSAPASMLDPVTGLYAATAGAISTALTLLSTGSPPVEALSPVFGAANAIRGTVTSQVNLAGNKPIVEAAKVIDYRLVWQAERDACVYCLGLSGEVVGAGEVFGAADRYAPEPKSYDAILEPPRHVNCRCTLAILFDDEYADTLRREADRSILRGFSLQSESNKVRVEAARRLLDAGVDAPKSVKEYAGRAVRDGKFPRGRDVPAGGPRIVIR